MNKKYKVYLASGWFNPAEAEIRDAMESLLDSREDVDLYSPKRDGTMLDTGNLNSKDALYQVFNENVSHILESDFVVANIYSGSFFNDTGTMYEIGYAIANGIPVIGFSPVKDNIYSRFNGLLESFYKLCYTYEDLSFILDNYHSAVPVTTKVLFVGNGDKELESILLSKMVDTGLDVRWVDSTRSDIYDHIEEIFSGITYMITVIDDKKTLVSWMMGQAHARGIPMITYTNHDYDVNVMLLCCLRYHIKGMSEFENFLHIVRSSGLSEVPEIDISRIKSR